MKKYFYLIIVLLLSGANNAVIAISPMKPIPVVVKVKKHCDEGFGICLILFVGKSVLPDNGYAEAEAVYQDGKLIVNISKDKLSGELLQAFESHFNIPVDEEIALADDIIEQLNLPQNAVLPIGYYAVEKEIEFFRIIVPVLK
jgi:hypothetical protein